MGMCAVATPLLFMFGILAMTPAVQGGKCLDLMTDREVCTQFPALCDIMKHLDDTYPIDCGEYMWTMCLPWGPLTGVKLDKFCTAEDRAKANEILLEESQKCLCERLGIGVVACNLKTLPTWWSFNADCHLRGICGHGATHAGAPAAIGQGLLKRQAELTARAGAARTAARAVAKEAGRNPAAIGQAGRHAANAVVKKGAAEMGVEVLKVGKDGVILKGAETGAQGVGAAVWGAVGPAIGGVVNAGVELHANGGEVNAKVVGRFGTGVLGNAIAIGAAGAAVPICGPFAGVCGPAVATLVGIGATHLLDRAVDTFLDEPLSTEDSENFEGAFGDATSNLKGESPKSQHLDGINDNRRGQVTGGL